MFRAHWRGPGSGIAGLAARRALGLAVLLSAGGCLSLGASVQCLSTDDCDAAEVCFEGRCATVCIDSADCAAAETCAQGICIPADLASCDALVCDETEGGCRTSSCLPGSPPRCDYDALPERSVCTLAAGGAGFCVDGRCHECDEATPCTPPGAFPECFSSACRQGLCEHTPLSAVSCQPAGCYDGTISDERLCGSDGSCPPAPGAVWCNGYACDASAASCLVPPCSSDAECVPTYYCDPVGACVAKLANGGDCAVELDHACRSGHCASGLCCDAGDCCELLADCPGSYTTPPACLERGPTTSCQGTAQISACEDFTCVSLTVQDDSACDGAQHDCADDLRPIACGGAVDQAVAVCPSACSLDAQCLAGRRCSGGACVCLSSLPEALCDDGLDNDCDDAFDCDDADCAGAAICVCVPNQTPEATCDDGDDNDCDGDVDCADDDCDATVCAPLGTCSGLACVGDLGFACSGNAQCSSGFCANGVCCNQACNAPASPDGCSAADACGIDGTCNLGHVVASGEGNCGTCFDCNGAGACAPVANGVADVGCDTPGSANGCSLADTCNGAGTCNPNHVAATGEGACPACQDCDGAGACINVIAGQTDSGCNAGADSNGCSGADACAGNGTCNFNHVNSGAEGNCATCEDCNGSGGCGDVPNGSQDANCDAGNDANGCSGADACSNGSCNRNHASAGSDGNCGTCRDCNGSGSCANVANGTQDGGCTGTCDSCQSGGCSNNAQTCWRDEDHDGYSSGVTATLCGACTGNFALTADTTWDCNDSKPDTHPNAPFSSSPRDCNGAWDCDCVDGVQQDRGYVAQSCYDPDGSCQVCDAYYTGNCGDQGWDDCYINGCGCNVGNYVSIGCR